MRSAESPKPINERSYFTYIDSQIKPYHFVLARRERERESERKGETERYRQIERDREKERQTERVRETQRWRTRQ